MNFSIEWLQLLTRVMADNLPAGIADVAYLVGETKGAELLEDSRARIIAAQKGGDGFGYCGFQHSTEFLKALGVCDKDIMGIEYQFEDFNDKVNTLTELINTVRFARDHGWRKLLLVAPHFHQLRSFITAVTAVDQEYPELKVYNCLGNRLDWNEPAVHSQGALHATTRFDLIEGEMKRIVAYQKDGQPYPLVSVERALKYLKERDTT